MRIAEFSAYRVRIPLKKKIRHASHTRDATDSLIVRCRLDNGVEGWGEGLPREYVTGESIETAVALLRNSDLERQTGSNITGIDDAIALTQSIQFAPPCLPTDRPAAAPRDCYGNSVRCAVELAILDAVTRAEGVPLSKAVSRVPEAAALLKRSDRVRYSAAITSMKPWKQAAMAGAIWLYGFHQTKVKVGVAEIDDVTSLRRIRRIVGSKIDIRIDANEAWSCAELEERLRLLAPFGVSAVEQPVAHALTDGLARIRPNVAVPIMLDESLCSLSDARHAIEFETCDIFNIRLSKCGGLVNSLKIAALAREHGLQFQLGCQVGETGILSAAGRHFATSVAGIKYLEGSYERHLVRERLTVEDLTFARGGWAAALNKPGLGVTINPAGLTRVTVSEDHWKLS